ncbi:hypothetical protein ACFYWO_03165 [Streptomyces sp. NPDC002932]|uniref:hypothetical protein n=1 Tax=Streptomyces sp. NPDC002932 TaxID=3364672 RepID=UPI003694CCD5
MTPPRAEEPEPTAFEKKLRLKGGGDFRGHTPVLSIPEPTRGPSDRAGVSFPARDVDAAVRPPEPSDPPWPPEPSEPSGRSDAAGPGGEPSAVS